MNARRGIRSVVLLALAGSAVLGWAAPPGVTEKVGQARSTPVPAPLPQAVPAGQGVRPSSGSRPSVALPEAPESPVAAVSPAAPTAPVAPRATLPSASLLTKRDVEVAPVAPSLAAHGLPLGVAMAPPAAGTDAGPPAKVAVPSAPKAVAKPKLHAPAKAAARAPADREPRLRPDPVVSPSAKSRGTPHLAEKKAGGAAKTVKRAAPHAAKSKKVAPPAKHHGNDGSRP
jgi:hypothetical protein